MMKKCIMITVIAFVISLVVGINNHRTFKDYNSFDYYKVSVMEGDFAVALAETFPNIAETDSSYIFKVKCMGNMQFRYAYTYQPVVVEKVFKGAGVHAGDEINISVSGCLFDDMTINTQFGNEMQSGKEYLVFATGKIYSSEHDFVVYNTSDFTMKSRISYDDEPVEVIKTNGGDDRWVNYKDVSQNEFFVDSQEGIDALLEMKKVLLEKFK